MSNKDFSDREVVNITIEGPILRTTFFIVPFTDEERAEQDAYIAKLKEKENETK